MSEIQADTIDAIDDDPDGEVRPSLCWYGDATLTAISELHVSRGELAGMYESLLTFRDDALNWWRPVANHGWVVLNDAGEKWKPRNRPVRLEGLYPCVLAVDPLLSELGETFGEESQVQASDVGPVRALELATALCREFYVESRLPMWEAEAALVGLYLMTGDGRVWACGVLSGRWHEFSPGGWSAADAPTVSDLLLPGADEMPSSPDAIRLLAEGPLFPEPISPVWDPPNR